MRASKLFGCLSLALNGVLGVCTLARTLDAQITVDGRVTDSRNHPVGGVDVGIYVPGSANPIASVRSDARGEYHFAGLQLTNAFDIGYTHSMYQYATVTRLAHDDPQHVSKVLYLKGERMPAAALDEQYLSARRIVFLAAFLENPKERAVFLEHFGGPIGMWRGLDRNVEDATSDKVGEMARAALERERKETLDLRPHVM